MEKQNTINPLLTNITKWVTDHFKNNPTQEYKGFNVHSYSKAEKDEAVATLNARGYKCMLENNDNHLSVAV